MKEEVIASQNSVERLDKSLKDVNEQYMFYQTVRDEIADVLDCLTDKAPLIEVFCCCSNSYLIVCLHDTGGIR